MFLQSDSARTPQRMVRLRFLLSIFVCVSITGAQNFRTVRGTVKDHNGKALAGAVVEIEDKTTLQIRTYRTQQDGAYHFGILFPDLTYHLHANYGGVSSHSKLLSRFRSREDTIIDFTIDLRKR